MAGVSARYERITAETGIKSLMQLLERKPARRWEVWHALHRRYDPNGDLVTWRAEEIIHVIELAKRIGLIWEHDGWLKRMEHPAVRSAGTPI